MKMAHSLVIVLLTAWTSVTSVASQSCYASCASNCHVCANFDTSGVTLKSDWNENAFPSETRAVPLGTDVYINGQRIGTVNCASTNGAICVRGSGLQIERDVLVTTGEFGLECRCENDLKNCSVVTVGLFGGGRHELHDVTKVTCGPCTPDTRDDGHSMPMRIVPSGSFDYQDEPAQPKLQPTALPTQSQFDNQPIIRNVDTGRFFGKIAQIPGVRSGSEQDDEFVEFCTNLDTSSITDSDWEERATGLKSRRSDSKSFQGDGQFIGTVTCASTNGEICVREEATNSEKAIFINQPFGLLCRCTDSSCSVGTFGFGNGGAEDQLTDVVYVACGPCHINSREIAANPPSVRPNGSEKIANAPSAQPTDTTDETLDSFGPAAPGGLPEALPFNALPNTFVSVTPFAPPAAAPLQPSQQRPPIVPSARFNPHFSLIPARNRAAPTIDGFAAVNGEKRPDDFLDNGSPSSVCAGFSTALVTAEADWTEQKHPSETVSLIKGSDLYPHTTIIGTLTCWDSGEWQSCISGKRANGTIGTFQSPQYASTFLECRCTSPFSCHVVSKGFDPDSNNEFVDITHIACGKC